MTDEQDPESDPRSVDELFFAALTESDDEAAWHAISALHFRGSREVLERSRALCLSDCAFERRLGADILGQLGVPQRTFPSECRAVLLKILAVEHDSDVLQSLLIALSHNDFDPRRRLARA
jgi:HEAT repeat protein